MRISIRLFAALTALAWLLPAAQTEFWSQESAAEFEKGAVKRLSISSDGRVTLAPRFEEVLDSASVYLWAIAEDSKGNVYAGGGGPGGPGARVYVIPPNGKAKTLVEIPDLEVHALAVDRNDQVYAATSPDGKVYRITPAGKAEVFYDPKAKYIWGMVFDSQAALFVATGDHGEIHKVSAKGAGKVFYKTEETHARAIAVDAKDNLIVGTEPGGLIVRVAPDGAGFVLYQAPRREITAVAVAKDGSIYAAGVGLKQAGAAAPTLGAPPSIPVTPQPQPSPVGPGATGVMQRVQPAPAPAVPAVIPGGSEIYRIYPDGFPRRVWNHPQYLAYAIAFDSEGRPLAGTGNKGAIYRLDSDLISTNLLSAPPTQVTALGAVRGGKLYAATGNVGKVYQIGPGLEKDGTLDSDVFDAGLFSYWGRLTFRGRANDGQISVSTRSGNLDRPEKDWSEWSPAITSADGGRIASPPARFLQWRARLAATGAGASPELRWVEAAYMTKNVAPVVQQIEVTPANYRFPPQASLPATTPPSLTLPPLGRPARPSTPALSGEGGATMPYAKGCIGARWTAADENGDSMIFTVQIRGEKESEWKPLEEKLTERRASWDSTAFPDGEYRLRVTASDERSQPEGQALQGELIGDLFTIDNTPPVISGLAAAADGGQLRVAWKAADALSVIEKAEMSVNGGEWRLVESTTRLSDSRALEYSVSIAKPAGSEQTIAVRVADENDNQAVAKVVVK
jgi:sugar lactone lactonase YvrE